MKTKKIYERVINFTKNIRKYLWLIKCTSVEHNLRLRYGVIKKKKEEKSSRCHAWWPIKFYGIVMTSQNIIVKVKGYIKKEGEMKSRKKQDG